MEVLLTTIGIITILKLFKKENFEETYYDSEGYYRSQVPESTKKELETSISTLKPSAGWGNTNTQHQYYNPNDIPSKTSNNTSNDFIKKNSLYLDKTINGVPLKDYYEKYTNDVLEKGTWFTNKDLPHETKQYQDDSIVQQKMQIFTGVQQQKDREALGKPNRTESYNFFTPQETATTYGYQYGGSGPGYTLSRQKELEELKKTIKFKTNEQPFEKLQVGRGISLETEVPAAGGFHQFTRVIPSNVSDYKSNQLPGMVAGGKWAYSNAPTSHQPVIKNKPNTFYTMCDHAPLPTKSTVTADRLRPDYNVVLKSQNRSYNNHGFGGNNLDSFLCK